MSSRLLFSSISPFINKAVKVIIVLQLGVCSVPPRKFLLVGKILTLILCFLGEVLQ